MTTIPTKVESRWLVFKDGMWDKHLTPVRNTVIISNSFGNSMENLRYSSALPASIYLDRETGYRFSVILFIDDATRDLSTFGMSFTLGNSEYASLKSNKTIDYVTSQIRYDVCAHWYFVWRV